MEVHRRTLLYLFLLSVALKSATSILEVCFYHNTPTEGAYVQCTDMKVFQNSSQNERLAKIENIQIGWNTTIPHLQYGLFAAFTNLKTLSLESANIETIDQRAFYGMSSIETLSFFNNKIARLEPGTFNQLYVLKYLDLGYNEIESLSDNLFASSAGLRQLILRFNNIENVTKETFTGLQFLQELNLSGNKIRSLNRDIFEDLSQLESLDLSLNQLQELPPTLFPSQFILRWLYLQSNNIQSLPMNLLQNTTNLEYLDVSNNLISKFPEEILNNTALETLNIERNSISHIDAENLLLESQYLEQIFLDFNPWNCDSLRDALTEFMENQLNFNKGTKFQAKNQVYGIECYA